MLVEVVVRRKDIFVEVIKRLGMEEGGKGSIVDSCVSCHHKELCVFYGGVLKGCNLELPQMQAALVVSSLAPHTMLLDKRKDIAVLKYQLGNLRFATASQHADVPHERPRFHVSCNIIRSSVEKGYVLLAS